MTATDDTDYTWPVESPYLLTTMTDGRGVAVTVTGDATTAVVEMTTHGEWSPRFGEQVAAGLRLCLAGPSASVIIDLRQLDDVSGLSMPFWMAAWRQARLAPSPVLLVFCLPATSLLSRRLRTAEGPRPRVFASATEARIAIAALMSPTDRLQARLGPHPGCARAARDLVKEACHAWQLPHLRDGATLVASELASNAIEHARTDFVVTLTRDAGRLHVAVQDGVTEFLRPPRSRPPAPASLHDRGRGLMLVNAVAAAWGAMPARAGKVVWATLA